MFSEACIILSTKGVGEGLPSGERTPPPGQRPYPPGLLSNDGHWSERYASYWNAYLFRCISSGTVTWYDNDDLKYYCSYCATAATTFCCYQLIFPCIVFASKNVCCKIFFRQCECTDGTDWWTSGQYVQTDPNYPLQVPKWEATKSLQDHTITAELGTGEPHFTFSHISKTGIANNFQRTRIT